MKIVMTILRFVLALALLFFGGNKLFHFVDPPAVPEAAQAYWEVMEGATLTMKLVGIVELLAGLSLIFKKYSALMMLILMSVSVNVIIYHIGVDPGSLGMGIVLIVLNVLMIYDHRDKYKELLS